ncbi:Rhodanese-related sulfurtransferase [Oceanospirillum multiglobuliferum]|uniref:Sulfurtransferase n=1 Tax=Oceanospirillum multiglobuliferum TaxID=64969 RepID=A0A1T4RZQ4_9GAMM|nr:rhodanese-like domain-containing protein [Oceanospirillum multiglobuliferum]OPX54549.1 sulfurtransferase [Oceanospirillum multiglobuliferum]SKA21474.1 Rhodanese-related sulfurtransferase [Oceanospirillum multiglobuliferum]
MLEQLIEFSTNNWMLVTAFVGLLVMWLAYEFNTGNKAVSCQEATLLVNREDGVFVDIRDRNEFRKGHIAGAQNISFASLKERIGELNKYKTKPVIVVCKMGQTASSAVTQLQQAGFENARVMRGGMSQWQGEKLPVVTK